MAEQKIRSYEVSIWTLQDRFISVLKWSELDCKGQIQSPEVTLNDDGTESFTFSIPKFYYNGATKIANPMWLHLENQPLEANMHKLKVIFNKNTEVEKVLEFLVTEVVQEHTSDNVMLNITTEGLAFNELGKIGYRLALSEQNYINALDKWTENGMVAADMPLNNIQFWNDLIFKDSDGQWRTNWTYEVQMDWSAFSTSSDGAYKKSNVVYEDEYVTSWNVTASDTLAPRGVQATQEKCRIITESESNIYNLTQAIAEQFGVFCRYEYEHDQNYQITGRKVIYYNNYLYDIAGHVDLTYPYSSASIKRTVDNADVITKMFVKSVDYNDDYVTIMDIDANESGEDYLLNFDYLHDIQAISDDQYDEVSKYKVTLHKINTSLKELQERIRIVENQLNEENAKVTTLENAVKLDQERYTEAGQERAAITDGTGFTRLDGVGCTVLHEKARGFYINIRWEGLQENTLKLYQNCDFSESENQFSGLISSYQFDRDEFQNITRIKNITAPTKLKESDKIWIKGYYNPTLAWDKVQKVWEIRLSRDQKSLATAKANVEKFEYYLNGDPNDVNLVSESCPNLYHQETVLLTQKQQAINSFERMMGPALREGYWDPENYHDYGDLYCDTITITSNSAQTLPGKSGFLEFKWDSAKYYDNEEPLIYTANTAGDIEQHLVIDLSGDIETYSSHLSDLCFVYCTPSSVSTIKEIEGKTEGSIENAEEWKDSLKETMYNVFRVGADCELGWVSTRGRPATRKPVLIVTGAKTLDNNTINFIRTGKYTVSTISVDDEAVVTTTRTLNKNEDAEYLAFIGLVEYDSDGQVIPNSWTNRHIVSGSNLFIGQRAVSGTPTPQEYQYVREYPRFYFNSLKLKQDEVKVVANQNLLQNYEDYSIVVDDRSTGLTPTGIGYYLTLKPEILLKAPYTATTECTIAYSLSNLDVAIYLDSLKVMNENSKPKVSYEIELSLLNPELIHTAYNRLNQIVHINDIDLQLEYVSGYISTVTMSLDKPWEDTVEIKNYETKFEDLFSTIVAQTQAMQSNGGILSALAGGTLSLKAGSVENTLSLNHDIIRAYLDSYFDNSQVVLDKLTALFTEAGEILASAGTTINRTSSLAIENINILQGFASQIARELAPKVVYGSVQPAYFKTGDIWIQTDQNGREIGRYVATADSTESKSGYGYTRTYDGTLAAIRGSNLQIDTVNGVVDVQAENEINLKSGGNVYIAADDRVDIVGNKQVNIGGTTVNIASSSDYTTGGINLVSSAISFSKTQDAYNTIQNAINSNDNGISKVLIRPSKIEMGSADILMRGNNRITMLTSRNDLSSTSAIDISPDKGIWIGSGRGIRLFSGGGTYSTDEDAPLGLNVSGASVELNDQHLILGYSSIQARTSTAIEMNQEHLMIAAGWNIGAEWQKSKSYAVGDIVTHENKYYKCTTAHTSGTTWDSSKWINHTYSITGTSNGLVGALFTKNSIGFATGSGNNINAILMNNNGITIGSGSIDVTQSKTQLRASTGSYVRIASDGIDLGTLANLYINANNFKLQTATDWAGTLLAIGKNLNGIGIGSSLSPADTNMNVNLLLNSNGLYINGKVYATEFRADGASNYFAANSNKLGFYQQEDNAAIITIDVDEDDHTPHIAVSKELDITAKNFYLHTNKKKNQTTSEVTFETTFGIGAGVTKYPVITPWYMRDDCSGIQYKDNKLYIKGALYTSSGRIGGWNIGQNKISQDKMELIGTKGNAGIYLSSGATLTALKVIYEKDKQEYIAYKHDNTTYYVKGDKGNSFTVTAENRGDIIEYLPEIVSVRPKYTKAIAKSAMLDDNTTVVYSYSETYIVDSDKKDLLYNNKPIIYDFSNSPTAEWYTQLQEAYPTKINNYVEYTESNNTTLQASTVANGTTLTKVSSTNVTFSVRASDGYMTVDNGKLGSFNLTTDGLSRGLLSHSTITKCTIDGYKSSQYGECFCNVEVNTKKGTITLKKINGEKIKINLAKMEALQKRIVETATHYTETGTSDDGSPIYTESSSGSSSSSCSTCGSTCGTACRGGCGSGCSNNCHGQCDNTCLGSCTGSCDNGCLGTAKATSCTTCGTTCGTTCTQTCANTCASNCTNTVSSHS